MISIPSFGEATALTILNFVVCSGVVFACTCRIRVMSEESTSKYFRISYALTLAMAFASGGSFWLYGEQAGFAQIGLAFAMLVWIGVGMHNWRGGPPSYARRPRFLRRKQDKAPPVIDVNGDTP